MTTREMIDVGNNLICIAVWTDRTTDLLAFTPPQQRDSLHSKIFIATTACDTSTHESALGRLGYAKPEHVDVYLDIKLYYSQWCRAFRCINCQITEPPNNLCVTRVPYLVGPRSLQVCLFNPVVWQYTVSLQNICINCPE